jgi:hypothetical protein
MQHTDRMERLIVPKMQSTSSSFSMSATPMGSCVSSRSEKSSQVWNSTEHPPSGCWKQKNATYA